MHQEQTASASTTGDDREYGPIRESREEVPGTATAYKGEPTATELGMLRVSLTDEQEEQIPGIVADSLREHRELYAQGKEAIAEHISGMIAIMLKEGRAVPLKEDFTSWEDTPRRENESGSSQKTSKFLDLLRRCNWLGR